MAKRRKRRKKVAQKRAYQKNQRPAQRLETARQALRSGDLSRSIGLATAALAAANDPDTLAGARRLAVEAYFRKAADNVDPRRRLHYLDDALEAAGGETALYAVKVHYHRGVILLRLGRAQEALDEFEFVAAHRPERPRLNVMRQLARLACGQPWEREGLSPEEQDWLLLLEGVIQGRELDQLLEELPLMMIPDEMQGVLRLLLQMFVNPSSAPVTRLSAAVEQAASLTSSPILPYYAGVAAARKGDAEAARLAWRQAAEGGLATSWFLHNRAGLARALAVELAQEGEWAAVLELAESDRLSGFKDKVLDETIGLAHFHLGYEAAADKRWATAAQHLRAADKLVSDRRLVQDLALVEEALEAWIPAAEAWREMVRRRPRKPDHPDYLTDAQVAAIWRHAADCYLEAEWTEDALTCMKTAVKYAPDDLELRIHLVNLYIYDRRLDAAANELDRILEIDPDHVPALIRLGAIYTQTWGRDPSHIWKRILAIEPDNKDAREVLAQYYLDRVEWVEPMSWTDRLRKRAEKEKIALLEEALEFVPGHPLLLIELGQLHIEIRKYKQAQAYLRQAWEAAPRDVDVVGSVLHELIHAKGGEIVKELLPQVRQMPGLLASFWIDQGRMALECDLGEEWAALFFDEAIKLAELRRDDDTPAGALLRIFVACLNEDERALANRYAAIIRKEVPNSGAVEYVEAARMVQDSSSDYSTVLRLFRKARRRAEKANEPAIVELAEAAEDLLSGRVDPLVELFNTLSPEELMDFFSRTRKGRF
jgi:tetratricopeptide (TPR) repeat protein